MGAFLIFVIVLIFYFLPSFNAMSRKHKNRDAILLVNLFFGWTVLGWLIALIWSTTN